MTEDLYMDFNGQRQPLKSIFMDITPEIYTMKDACNIVSELIQASHDEADCQGPAATFESGPMTLPDGRVAESIPSKVEGVAKGMNKELNRLRTFENWPRNNPVSYQKLAKAGLYYSGLRDAVICFSCGGQIEGWDYGDTAMGEHKRLFPKCDFVNGKDKSNEPLLEVKEKPEFTQRLSSRIEQSQRDIEKRAKEKAAEIERVEPSGTRKDFISTSSASTSSNYSAQDETMEDEDKGSSLLFGKYHQEHVRLQSFKNWPRTSPIEPRDLARAGFYYLNREDAVQCFACFGEISRWKPCDVPMVEHQTHFPNCPFVKGLDVGNEPISTPPVTRHAGLTAPLRSFSTPAPNPDQLAGRFLQRQRNLRASLGPLNNCKHPNFVQEAARLETFRFWPGNRGLHIVPRILARAGFYFTGNADECKCFYCDGGLKNWEPTDEPWTEHAKWFPRCEWLIQQRGQAFITHVQTVNPPPINSPGMDVTSPSFGTEEPYSQVEPPHRFEATYLERQPHPTSRSSPPQARPRKEMTIEEEKAAAHREFNSRQSELEAAAEVVFKPRTKKVEEAEPSALRSKTLDENSDATSFIQAFMHSSMANMAVEMGYHPDLVRFVATKHFKVTGREFSSPDDLLEAIWEAQGQGIDPTPSGGKAAAGGHDVDYLRKPPKEVEFSARAESPSAVDVQAEKLAGLSIHDEPRKASPSRTAPPPTPIGSLQNPQSAISVSSNQSSAYLDKQLCKICLDKELSTVFLPCKHLATCRDCAQMVNECPMCRQPIIDSLNIFMS